MYDGLLDELLSYDELRDVLLSYDELLPCVDEPAGFLYVCPVVLRLVVPTVAPDDAGLLDEVLPLPTAARVETVLLVPNDALDVVALLPLTEELLPDDALFTLAVVLPPMVSPREPL